MQKKKKQAGARINRLPPWQYTVISLDHCESLVGCWLKVVSVQIHSIICHGPRATSHRPQAQNPKLTTHNTLTKCLELTTYIQLPTDLPTEMILFQGAQDPWKLPPVVQFCKQFTCDENQHLQWKQSKLQTRLFGLVALNEQVEVSRSWSLEILLVMMWYVDSTTRPLFFLACWVLMEKLLMTNGNANAHCSHDGLCWYWSVVSDWIPWKDAAAELLHNRPLAFCQSCSSWPFSLVVAPAQWYKILSWASSRENQSTKWVRTTQMDSWTWKLKCCSEFVFRFGG